MAIKIVNEEFLGRSQLDWTYPKKNLLLHAIIEGQMTEVKGVGRKIISSLMI